MYREHSACNITVTTRLSEGRLVKSSSDPSLIATGEVQGALGGNCNGNASDSLPTNTMQNATQGGDRNSQIPSASVQSRYVEHA